MVSAIESSDGLPLLVQSRGEHQRQRAVGYGLAALCLGAASVLAYSEVTGASPSVAIVPVFLIAGLGVAAVVLAIRQRPFALYESGIQTPSGRFLLYRSIRDAQRIERPGRRSRFLVLAFKDGKVSVIGSPLTKNVLFATAQFDAVESLVTEGVKRKGATPTAIWDTDLWERIYSLRFRGPVIANVEKVAQEQAVARIDQSFLESAARTNRRLSYWLIASASATARDSGHPKRNSTP